MSKILRVRAPQDEQEEKQIRPPGRESAWAGRLDPACQDRGMQLGRGARRSDCQGAAL
ncbi:MAG: hypothetical protein ACXWPS_10915 [Ktedonobacteraceae bacterium]